MGELTTPWCTRFKKPTDKPEFRGVHFTWKESKTSVFLVEPKEKSKEDFIMMCQHQSGEFICGIGLFNFNQSIYEKDQKAQRYKNHRKLKAED